MFAFTKKRKNIEQEKNINSSSQYSKVGLSKYLELRKEIFDTRNNFKIECGEEIVLFFSDEQRPDDWELDPLDKK